MRFWPFLYQAIGDYQVEAAKATRGASEAKGAHLDDLLDFARLRPLADASLQQSLI